MMAELLLGDGSTQMNVWEYGGLVGVIAALFGIIKYGISKIEEITKVHAKTVEKLSDGHTETVKELATQHKQERQEWSAETSSNRQEFFARLEKVIEAVSRKNNAGSD